MWRTDRLSIGLAATMSDFTEVYGVVEISEGNFWAGPSLWGVSVLAWQGLA